MTLKITVTHKVSISDGEDLHLGKKVGEGGMVQAVDNLDTPTVSKSTFIRSSIIG